MCGPKRFSEDIDGCNEKKIRYKYGLADGGLQIDPTERVKRGTEPVHSPASQALNAAERSVLTMVSSLVGGFSFTSTLDLE